MSPVGWTNLFFKIGLVLLAFIAVVHPSVQSAEESYTKVTGVRLVPTEAPDDEIPESSADKKGWSMAAEFDIKLSYKLQEAANKGLPLNFAVDFKLVKPRWYWTDKEVVVTSYPMVLSYHALTRTYRVVTAQDTFTSPDLDSAVKSMTKLAEWQVIPRGKIKIGETYLAQVRFRLDVAELSKPFQINAFTSSQWILSSDWLEFEFTPRAELP